jgi:hypothetical protein
MEHCEASVEGCSESWSDHGKKFEMFGAMHVFRRFMHLFISAAGIENANRDGYFAVVVGGRGSSKLSLYIPLLRRDSAHGFRLYLRLGDKPATTSRIWDSLHVGRVCPCGAATGLNDHMTKSRRSNRRVEL